MSFQNFFDSMGKILEKHAPLIKLKHKHKFKTKPWISTALEISTSIMNNGLIKKT